MTEGDFLIALRAARDEMARRHGGDAWSLVRELADRSRNAGRKPIRLPRREPVTRPDLRAGASTERSGASGRPAEAAVEQPAA